MRQSGSLTDRFVTIPAMLALAVFSVPARASAQPCTSYLVGGTPTQSADIVVKTTDGACTIDAADNGGYIKTSTTYTVHETHR